MVERCEVENGMADKAEPDAGTDVAKGAAGSTEKVADNPAHKLKQAPGEIGGPKGPEPTRYGDWEVGGIVSDF